jgi:GTP1/Obg family GTP-binding protein
LRRELPAIVKAIEAAAGELVAKLEEAERQAEVRRLERRAEDERRRQEEERRQVHESIQESREQLAEIIRAWGEVINIERFLQGVQDQAQTLPDNEQALVLKRLKLAREFMGAQDPMEFFRTWKTPLERYRPLEM